MTGIKYCNLPACLRELIDVELFMFAVPADNPDNIIVWVLDTLKISNKELEYSISKSRFLSIEERITSLKNEEIYRFPKLGVELHVEKIFEKSTGVQLDIHRLRSIDSGVLLIEKETMHYFYSDTDINDVVEQLLSELEFPALYLKMPEDDKINYWVSYLYRAKRQSDGYCNTMIDFFDMSLIAKMRELDPEINIIIAKILEKLASFENMDRNLLVREFNERTGFNV